MTASVSAVIVNFNSGPYLTTCLSSLGQGVSGLEADAIVVDNASTDGSAEIAVRAVPSVRRSAMLGTWDLQSRSTRELRRLGAS